MKPGEFITDHLTLFILNIFCMFLLSAYLYATGNPPLNIAFILIAWLFILILYSAVQYYNRNRFFQKAQDVLEKLDQRYLFGELLPPSHRYEDRLYREMMQKSNKSVIERIHALEDARKEYQEYIESWVHEIKAPITSIGLFCENNKNELTRKILLENQRIENYADVVLYYARSENVHKDYLITETDLNQIVLLSIAKNKQYLIQNQVQIEVDCSHHAFTDGKWIGFILNQLLLNSIKYRRETNALIHICTAQEEHSVLLIIEDNGMGIPPEDQARIFDKGFTGSNGRIRGRSTGMGLYLCKKLCQKLGISIRAESKVNEYTKIILEFPVSSYLSKL